MPLATLHLISITSSTSLTSFLSLLSSLPQNEQPIVTSKVIRWIITPKLIDTDSLLHPKRPYDLLLVFVNTNPLPQHLLSGVDDHFHIQIGIPSRLLKNFSSTNNNLLHPSPSSIPSLTGALNEPIIQTSSQTLSLSQDLQSWIQSFARTRPGQQPVSMLNLLAFIPEKKQDYLRYGQEFAKSIGSRRGGNAKLVGHVVYPSATSTSPPSHLTEPTKSAKGSTSVPDLSRTKGSSPVWDEFALAHYPSILHFADMLASKDYQDVNQKYRVPSLKDTCILCTSEIEIEDLVGKHKGEKAKL